MCPGFGRWVALIGLYLLLTGPAQAQELLAVGTRFPGVFELQADGQYRGLATSVLRETLEPLGYSLRFALYPWARAQHMVELGQADILIGPYKNAEREARFAFSARAFYRDRIVFYRDSSRLADWGGDYSQLVARRIGVVRGWSYGERFEHASERLDLVTVAEVENGLRMLALGRLDLLASNQRNTRPALQALGMSARVSQLAPPIDQQDGYFAFPREERYRRLRMDFDRAFEQLIEQGRLAQLAAQRQVAIP